MALESRRFNKQSVNLPFLLEWTEKLNLRLATRAYTVSQALKDYFVGQGIDRNKLRVIPNGVDVQRFSPDVEGCWVREKHHLNGQVVLGFVGSFHYWHGVEYFSEYVRRLSDKHDNVRFLFVGDGPMRRELQQSVIDIGLSEKVILPGYVRHDDIPGYVAVMDIALAPYPPSDFFYFSPLKIFEYMAAGKPTVASDIGQISELIEDGKTGMLYQAGDLDTLISKSSELIDNANLRTNMGTAARQASCEKYSWAANAREIIQLINEALDVRS
jgi:glycosyltransferase involved in cell wall biosynthesis